MKDSRLLVQIDPDKPIGREILPSQGDIQWLSSHDNAIYEVLKIGPYGHYEEMKDIISGETYESSLSPNRFRVIYDSGLVPEESDIAPKVKEDETIII